MSNLDTLTTPAADPVTHPHWCDPARCTVEPDLPLADAVHLSSAAAVDGAITTLGPEDVDVWLHQSAAGGDVYLVIHPLGTKYRAMLSLATAAVAVTAISQLLAQATTDSEGADPS